MKVDVRGPDDCWPWLAAVNSDGYGVIRDADGRLALAHRIALRLDGRDPGSLKSLHSCDSPPCQNPAHLRAGTQAENLAEMSARGRHVPSRAKLTPALVGELRALAGAASQRELAARFGVSQPTVSEILSGRTWNRAA